MFTVWPVQSAQRERAGSGQVISNTYPITNENERNGDAEALVTAIKSNEIGDPVASKILGSDGANLTRALSACGQQR